MIVLYCFILNLNCNIEFHEELSKIVFLDFMRLVFSIIYMWDENKVSGVMLSEPGVPVPALVLTSHDQSVYLKADCLTVC